ncbi:DNA repair photolyase [Aequitasia blattaphilus]|uniref:Radical SAM protein n=1 Tax=Aequitasia blattaphilus TaxID=2949332 RepID=A0ABT1E5G9_9FIRM|nr:radical SAM protein [Aequitasia blattaphilus]MCP1101078.1 radical SAM protein [Aequitasia blattaphilus]MCR8613718.1 radical SAM protein [Aequitasia blattaphilus]
MKKVEYIEAKTIVTRSNGGNSWFGMDYNMNIYKGCSHGCIYCDSRSDCYGVNDFDEVRVKKDALIIIRDELRRKVKKGVIATGAMSDPYNPLEKELKLTRNALELMNAFEFGVAIATKSDLILRDIEVLKSITEHSPVLCKITITTADDELSKKIEPGAPLSSRRFEVLRELGNAGIFSGILLMPVLPFLEDSRENILNIIHQAKEAGAKFIYPAFGVTLRGNQRDWFFKCLEEQFPNEGLQEKYIKSYRNNYKCVSGKARELWGVFSKECEKQGILYKMKDIIHVYKSPYKIEQLNLFN